MLGLMIVKDRFSSHNLNFQELSQAMSDSRSQLLDQNCLTPPSISPRWSQVTIPGAPRNNSSNPLSQNIQLLRILRPRITNTTRVTRHIIHGLIKEMVAMMIPKMTLILRCSLKSSQISPRMSNYWRPKPSLKTTSQWIRRKLRSQAAKSTILQTGA